MNGLGPVERLQTPAERYEGALRTDRGFEHAPPPTHLQGWLSQRMAA